MRLLGMLLAMALVIIIALPASGGERKQPSPEQMDAARALAEAGFQLYERGDYATSLNRFIRAEEIYHAAPHLLYIGRTSAHIGKLVEARKAYEQLVNETLPANVPDQFRTAQVEAKAELEQLRGRIPSLMITVTGVSPEQASVSIDGQAVAAEALGDPVEVNPGTHAVELRAEGREPTRQQVQVEEGSQAALELAAGAPVQTGSNGAGGQLPPVSPPDEDPSIVPPIIVGGVGVALIAVGAITGVITLNDAAELKDRCPQNPCPAENESLGDDIVVMSTVSTVGFIAGGAAVAAGVLWLVLQGIGDDGDDGTTDTATGPSVRVVAGGTYLGLEGTF